MPKKRKTLPKNFEELLKKGNIDELKKIFDQCEIDARGGYGKFTALAFEDCPHELAKWLVEQGADLHAKDTWGRTPLHNRASNWNGNIKSLIDLGADVNCLDNYNATPLHSAARYIKIESTKILLAHGAKTDIADSYGNTPLEYALQSCNNIDIPAMVELGKVYLDAGVPVTPKIKKLVTEIGKEFEFHRANFNKDDVEEYSKKLDELYALFGVEPVARRNMHDGKSPITTKEKTWQKQHQDLWEQLVPGSGPTQTMQGEVIRITGRIANELDGNGGINWDSDYKKMADTFLQFVKQGNQLSSSELSEAEALVQQIKQREGRTARMAELGVKWVINNPEPVKLPAVNYSR